jgi:hypothetical protein
MFIKFLKSLMTALKSKGKKPGEKGFTMELYNEVGNGWVHFWLKRDPQIWPINFRAYLKTNRKWG